MAYSLLVPSGYVILIVLFVLALVVSPQVSRMRQKKLREVTIDSEKAKQLRRELLAHVRRETRQRDQPVDLSLFWNKQHHLTEADRHAIANPLFQTGELVPCRDVGRGWFSWLRDDVLHLLPGTVALSEKGWDLMIRAQTPSLRVGRDAYLGGKNTHYESNQYGAGQQNVFQTGAGSTPSMSGNPVNQPTVSAPIAEFREMVRLFAEALENEGDALSTDARDEARIILDGVQGELDGEASTDTMARSAKFIYGIALGAMGSGAWQGVADLAHHLMRAHGVHGT